MIFGSILAPKLRSKNIIFFDVFPRWPQERPKRPQEASKRPPRADFESFWASFWKVFGIIFGIVWTFFIDILGLGLALVPVHVLPFFPYV